jgi:hypothetical protein
MKRLYVVALSFFVFISCNINKNIFDPNYKGEKNYKMFYVVDTIIIDKPIIIDYQGGKFVFSKTLIEKNSINRAFLKRPDVFLLGSNLYYDLWPEDYKKYIYPDNGKCDDIISINSKNKNILSYEYADKSVRFILCLINSNYYNVKHNTVDGEYYQITSNDIKNSFFKIVYPICE